MRGVLIAAAVLLLMAGVTWLGWRAVVGPPAPAPEDRAAHTHPGGAGAHELATYMDRLQRFSQKLGYAVEGRNAPLADFYLHEIEETLDEIAAFVPEHDGFDIPDLLEVFARPEADRLETAVAEQDWDAAWRGYELLIHSCNTCHAATDHDFIIITPATGDPPFNQLFREGESWQPAPETEPDDPG